jgi:hypothetical protein
MYLFVMDVPCLSGPNSAAPLGKEAAAALSPHFLPVHFDASTALGRRMCACACGCCCDGCSKDGCSKGGSSKGSLVVYGLEAIVPYGERHYVTYSPARGQPGAWWELNDGAAALLPSLRAMRERMRTAGLLPVLAFCGAAAPAERRRCPWL